MAIVRALKIKFFQVKEYETVFSFWYIYGGTDSAAVQSELLVLQFVHDSQTVTSPLNL